MNYEPSSMNPQIIYRKTTDLDPLYKNPRYIRDADFAELCKSIHNLKYFEARPLIISNRTGLLVILAGNMRHKAAINEGIKEVPTFLIEGLTEAEEKEITIRDNVSNGDWDYDMLANEWDKDQLIEWGVPAMWDLKDEEYKPEKVKNAAVPKITIEFVNDYQRDQALTEIQELLKSYEGAEVK